MSYVLALDQGTTSSRAMLFDANGRVVSQAQRALTQSFPRPGWVEHDGDEILTSQLACAREALASAGIRAAALAGLGITNQRETTLLWERASGRALAPAIVWQDRRTAAACDRLRAEACRLASREDGAGARSLLLRDQAGLVAEQRAGCACACRAWRARLRYGGQLAGLAPHRRAATCHGCGQRIAHLALQHP